MATNKLNLTRDQLATFLKNHEQIKQFERLFAIADEVSPSSDTTGISIQAGNADAAANEALAQIVRLAQDSAINSGATDQKAVQALDALQRIADALELLALAPTASVSLEEAIGMPAVELLQPDNLAPPIQVGTLGQQQADRVSISGGTVSAQLKNNQTILLETTATLTNGAAAAAGTLTNAPAAGNPTKWVAINDNGITRYIPTW